MSHFLVGKFLAGLVSLALFALIARTLGVEEYGAYVAFIALCDLGISLSEVGLDWIAVRFIPEYRANAPANLLGKLIGRLYVSRALVLGLVVCIGFALERSFLEAVGLTSWSTVAWLYLALLFVEGLARFGRNGILDSLFLQGASQVSQLGRNVMLFSLLGLSAATDGTFSLVDVVRFELLASAISLLPIGMALGRHLRESTGFSGRSDWRPPSGKHAIKLGLHNYFSSLIALAYSAQMLTLLITRMFGVADAGLFGFARNFTDQVRRYLPATLLMGLIRPFVISRYSADGDFSRMRDRATIVFKISIVALGLLCAEIVALATPILRWLSDGKFQDSSYLVMALLVSLIPLSHRQLLELVVNTVGRSELWLYAALAGLFGLPIGWAFAAMGAGLLGFVIGVLVSEFLANLVLIRGLRSAGFSYVVDWRGVWSTLIAVLVSGAAWRLVGNGTESSVMFLVVAGGICVTYLALVWLLMPFTSTEQGWLRHLARRA